MPALQAMEHTEEPQTGNTEQARTVTGTEPKPDNPYDPLVDYMDDDGYDGVSYWDGYYGYGGMDEFTGDGGAVSKPNALYKMHQPYGPGNLVNGSKHRHLHAAHYTSPQHKDQCTYHTHTQRTYKQVLLGEEPLLWPTKRKVKVAHGSNATHLQNFAPSAQLRVPPGYKPATKVPEIHTPVTKVSSTVVRSHMQATVAELNSKQSTTKGTTHAQQRHRKHGAEFTSKELLELTKTPPQNAAHVAVNITQLLANIAHGNEASDRMLRPEIFEYIQARAGMCFDIDGAANPSGDNAQCAEFCTAERSFTHTSLRGKHIFVNPPYHMISEFLSHYQVEKNKDASTSIVWVVPVWKKQPWYKYMKKNYKRLFYFPKGSYLFTRPSPTEASGRLACGPTE